MFACSCGLGTRTSDIDVVLVGIMEPPKDVGFYSKQERPRVSIFACARGKPSEGHEIVWAPGLGLVRAIHGA